MKRSRYRVTKTTRNSSCVLTEIPAPRDTRAPQHQRHPNPDHRSRTRIRTPPGNGQSGIASHEMPSRKRTQHMMRKTKCETVSFLISFEYENFTFTIQNSWPKISAQCRCKPNSFGFFFGRAARNNASSNASPLRGVRILQSVSGAVVHGHCRLIQRNQQQNKQDANEHRAISAGSTPSTHPMHSWQREAAATAQ